jgi:hypothetical protein
MDLVTEEERTEEERGPNGAGVEEERGIGVVEEEQCAGVEEERGTGVEEHAEDTEEGMRWRADAEEGAWWRADAEEEQVPVGVGRCQG